MAGFKYSHHSEKKALQERALKLKPTAASVVATEQGWAHPRPNGTMELLVSFKGLDALLGDDVPEQVGEPLTLVLEPVEGTAPAPVPEVVEPIVIESFPVVAQDDEQEPVVVPRKKPGRPAKVTEENKE